MRLRSSGQTSYALAGASECGPFLANEADRILGPNYQGLLAAKRAYDHAALFFVRRGTGSGHWSDDGFTRLEEFRARRPPTRAIRARRHNREPFAILLAFDANIAGTA